MFNKDLFISLCKKYNVELSETAITPMIKEGTQVHAITINDVNRIFAPYQSYIEYSNNNKIKERIKAYAFYMQEDYAIAC